MIHEIYPEKYDPTYINKKTEEQDFLLNYEKDCILVKYENDRAVLPRCRDYKELCGEEYEGILDNAYYLFSISDKSYFEAINLSSKIKTNLTFYKNIEETEEKKPQNGDFFYIKIHSFRELDPIPMVFAGATGYHIRNWRISASHCGYCGAKTKPSLIERSFVCEECGREHFPKISPAVIVAVTNGEKILLVKNLRRPNNVRLELVSGYVEIGESFEQAVHREVLEEVGLKVKNVRYYKDQPWGISGAHMIGFYAEVDGDDTIRRQEDEISEAKWYKRDEIPKYRNRLSVGTEMIIRFKEKGREA
ncbi:MAG: NAD(+) diphosphatase [Lachnospiraceae bacterium]|nr:NAD(+) diphosphatase [Lachnospiraceae bacterium]